MKIVTLLTDFGDFYPGVMKGVILSIAPEVRIVDIAHNVEPQNILQGSFLLYHSYRFFKKAIHVAVVDPGVGSDRKAIAIETTNHVFIAPDNGIAYPAAKEDGIKRVLEIDTSISELVGELSTTFHGRDIFAPAAALAAKGELEKYCSEIDEIERLELFDYSIDDRTIECRIVYIDRFGNLVTNLKRDAIGNAKGFYFSGIEFPLVRTYADVKVNEPLALIGSFNTLELSVREGNAAEMLGIKREGTKIRLEVIV